MTQTPTSPAGFPGTPLPTPAIDASTGSPSSDLRRPRVWTVFVALIAALATSLIISSIAFAVMAVARTGSGLGEPKIVSEAVGQVVHSRAGVLVSIFVSAATFGALALFGAWLSPMPGMVRLRLGPAGGRFAARLIFAIGAAALGLASGAFTSLVLPAYPNRSLELLGKLKSDSGGQMVFTFVLLGGLVPFAEELFFRGYCQTRLRDRWGPGVAIAITALAFGTFHMNLVQGLSAVVLGVYFGWGVERAKSIRPAILAHVTNNMVATTVFMVSGSWRTPGGDRASALLVIAVGVIVAAGAAWTLSRAYPTEASRRKGFTAGPSPLP